MTAFKKLVNRAKDEFAKIDSDRKVRDAISEMLTIVPDDLIHLGENELAKLSAYRNQDPSATKKADRSDRFGWDSAKGITVRKAEGTGHSILKKFLEEKKKGQDKPKSGNKGTPRR